MCSKLGRAKILGPCYSSVVCEPAVSVELVRNARVGLYPIAVKSEPAFHPSDSQAHCSLRSTILIPLSCPHMNGRQNDFSDDRVNCVTNVFRQGPLLVRSLSMVARKEMNMYTGRGGEIAHQLSPGLGHLLKWLREVFPHSSSSSTFTIGLTVYKDPLKKYIRTAHCH